MAPRDRWSAALISLGVAATAWGAGLLHPAAGLIVAGIALLVIGVALGYDEGDTPVAPQGGPAPSATVVHEVAPVAEPVTVPAPPYMAQR